VTQVDLEVKRLQSH